MAALMQWFFGRLYSLFDTAPESLKTKDESMITKRTSGPNVIYVSLIQTPKVSRLGRLIDCLTGRIASYRRRLFPSSDATAGIYPMLPFTDRHCQRSTLPARPIPQDLHYLGAGAVPVAPPGLRSLCSCLRRPHLPVHRRPREDLSRCQGRAWPSYQCSGVV